MTKASLQELAVFGVRVKLANMERELRELFRDFPQEFASKTPPVLLVPETKANGNSWPSFKATLPASNGTTHAEKIAALWTPARRRKQARLMKARSLQMHQARRVAAKKRRRSVDPAAVNRKRVATRQAHEQWGTRVWHRAHDFLAGQPGRQAKIVDIMKGADIKTSPSFISAAKDHPELFKKIGKGTYALKKVAEHQAGA